MELIPWLVAGYVLICMAAYFGNRLFMYFPDPTRVAPGEAGLDGVTETEITVGDGIRLVAWHAPAKRGKPTVLYFHGNAANAANRAPKIETIRKSGFGVFYLKRIPLILKHIRHERSSWRIRLRRGEARRGQFGGEGCAASARQLCADTP
jgi:hypothetical protein